MPAYHSAFNDNQYRTVGNLALLPIKTKIRGPAPPPVDPTSDDVIDEAINLFRANCLFRNYEIQGNGDRVLIYIILFISECLSKLGSQIRGDVAPSAVEAQKQLLTLALSNFALPGDGNFPLNAMYDKPKDRAESDNMRAYLSQLRQETATRLVDKVYSATYPDTEQGKRPTKWWLSFQKRKFMNKSF